MDDYDNLSHSVWDCKYHVVFIPKYRKKALYGELRRRMGEMIRTLAAQKVCKVLEGHVMPDHVHMLIAAATTQPPWAAHFSMPPALPGDRLPGVACSSTGATTDTERGWRLQDAVDSERKRSPHGKTDADDDGDGHRNRRSGS
jgi:putative transposase